MTILASIRNQLLPGLLEITGEYPKTKAEWEKVFTTKTSRMAQERSLQVRYVGPARAKQETQSVYYDNESGDRWVYTMEPVEATIGYSMSRKAVDDGLYRENFNPANLGLQQAMRAFWNATSANVLNTASTYNAQVGGDGQAILSVSHPYDGGTWANTHSTPLSLNESSLISAAKSIRTNFVDEAGILQDIFVDELIIPVNLEDTAMRLLQTELQPGSANNDINVIPKLAGGVKGYQVFRYLTSNYAWFTTTSVKSLLRIERKPFETDMYVDFDTQSLKVTAYERAGFFCNDSRGLWGEMATA